MNIKKKKILIKVTSSIGTSMISNAEYHTLFYFCKWLSKDCDIVVSGIEKHSQIIEDLKKFNVKIKKPFLKYLFLKKFKYFFISQFLLLILLLMLLLLDQISWFV